MSSVQVNLLTLISKVHIEQGRYALSFDVTQKKKSETVKKKRKAEEQAYMEYGCIAGGYSPEIELSLKNRKCEIQFSISGALKPTSPLEVGEDVIEYNEALSECRKLLTLVPTYDASTEGTATIKFKVEGKVKHTVHIHDIPTERDLNRSSSSSSSFVSVRGADRQMSMRSNPSCQSIEDSLSGEDGIMEGSVREQTASTSGEGYTSQGQEAVPVPPMSLTNRIGGMAIRDRGPDVVPPEQSSAEDTDHGDTAYDKMLCNESLNTLAWALSPADANRLLIGLGVPNQVLAQNQKNNAGDVVSGNYDSFRHWRSQHRSRRQAQEASNQNLYEDLIVELGDIGRKDIKVVIKRALEENKKLDKNDFKHL